MATAPGGYSAARGNKDPYRYQVGFGNLFASEAIPGTLPIGQNNPQKVKFDLYTESVNGTPFTTPRAHNQHNWFYRIRPSVAHQGFVKSEKQNAYLEAEFTTKDPKQHVLPSQVSFPAIELAPSDELNFFEGLRTLMGNGSALSREGLALHLYACNVSMEKTAFVNSDGDFLIVPCEGRLDIQTEMGKLMVSPGEIAVIQRGIKWKVVLPDGLARGYVQEIFGSHYELPELGAIGANGLANVRDFEHPVAHFDIDQTPWEVVYKLAGQLFTCRQGHTPFDVVAWHGNYVPYKYDTESFVAIGSISKDHPDPSLYTVLTAPSKTPGASLVDFAIFKERWDVASDTFRPPYYHRNTCTEAVGLVLGSPGGRADYFKPGGIAYETGFCPHGPSEGEFNAASNMELSPMKVFSDMLIVMFESSMMVTVTDWAAKAKTEQPVSLWTGLSPGFLQHTDEINAALKAAGRPTLQTK